MPYQYVEPFEAKRRCETWDRQCPQFAEGEAVGRSRLFKALAKAWEGFKGSYEGLTESELMEKGVTGDWSVRDLIAHVTWWEEEAMKHLPLILKGLNPPKYSVMYGGIDPFNAMMAKKKRGLSLRQVFREQEVTHHRLMEFLQGVPVDQFSGETRFRRRLRLDTYGHYRIHGHEIRQWREARLLGRPSCSAGEVGRSGSPKA